MRAQTPSPKSVPFGTTTAARPGLAAPAAPTQLSHDELKEQQRRLGRLHVAGEVALDAGLLFTTERRVGEDDIDAIFVAQLGELEAEAVAGVDLGRFESVQEEVHLAEQVRQRLGLAAVEAVLLEVRRSSTV